MKNTTIEQWNSDVLNSKNPVLVDFWAAWCGPCRSVAPVFEQLSEEFKDKMDFVKVNVDESQEIAQKYNISSIPTLVVFKDGKVVDNRVGAASKDSLKQFIEKNLN